MSYSAEVSRPNPGCITFLIDQSGSMADPFGGEHGVSKAQKLADALNRLIFELTIRCTKDQTEGVRNYFDVCVLGYGASVGPCMGGSLTGRDVVPLKEVADNPSRVEERRRKVEDGTGGLVEELVKVPVWFDPRAENGTPMSQSLSRSRMILEPWINSHPSSFPPIVINITDGEATDGDPRAAAGELRGLSTSDGNVLLFNVHLSSRPSTPVLYPESSVGLADEFAQQLFEMSSVLPPHLQDAAKAEGYAIGPQSRGFAFNVEIVEVIKFLDIGTRPKALR